MSRIQQDEPILHAFAPLLGLPAWGVMKCEGCMVSLGLVRARLAFREPITSQASTSCDSRTRLARRRGKPVGAWDLWFYWNHLRHLVHEDLTAWNEDAGGMLNAA